MAGRRSLLYSTFILLTACGDAAVLAETSSTTAADASATGDSSSSSSATPTSSDATPTTAGDTTAGDTTAGDTTTGDTTAAPFDPCACDDPVFHIGDLKSEDLATYQDTCLAGVTGNIVLEAVDPAQMGVLANITGASYLAIYSSPGLTDLAPLACLRGVDHLYLAGNPDLVDLSALSGVERAEILRFQDIPISDLPTFAPEYEGLRSLVIKGLPELRDLDAAVDWPGLHSGDSPSGEFSVEISDAPKLASVAGLGGAIASAAAQSQGPDSGWVQVELSDLPALVDLQGLEGFTKGVLYLRRLAAVADLVPLKNLERAGNLTLAGMSSLASLAGLDALVEVGQLELGGCEDGDTMPALTSLAGAGALAEISGALWIVDAPQLIDLGLPALTAVDAANFVDTPALADAKIAAFNAQTNAATTCTGDVVACSCIDRLPETVVTGCPQAWSGGSMVTGVGDGEAFTGTTAFFGWVGGDHVNTTLYPRRPRRGHRLSGDLRGDRPRLLPVDRRR